ncbi:MAG TPA: DUF1415 domain-containing protein, partial [Kineobactrum sp.]
WLRCSRSSLRIALCAAADSPEGLEQMQRDLLCELDLLQRSPEQKVATTLLAFTGGLADFDEFLDFLDLANELLIAAGLEGHIQLASFHPDYLFAGEAADAASHYSNRAPLPVIHLLREDMVERALADYPDPESIPVNNIARLSDIGRDQLALRLALLRSS